MTQPEPAAFSRRDDLKHALRQFGKNPVVLAGGIISAGTLFIAAFATILVNPNAANTSPQLSLIKNCWNNPLFGWGPNIASCAGPVHPLGTDAFGRDLLQMIILSIPVDVTIALEVVASALLIGIVLGATAGYVGGILDEAILRITDIFLALPGILLAIVFLFVFPDHTNFTILTVAIAVVWWPTYVRLIRSQVLGEKEKPYVESLRAIGAGRIRILFRHIVPNCVYPLFVQATLDLGTVILVISALTFIGLSPKDTVPELGNLASKGFAYFFTGPWEIIFPGLTILLISLGFNLLGDGIRDVLDPRQRR